MLDHLGIQCSDHAAAIAFYDAVLAPLGSARIMDYGQHIGYGGKDGKPEFWISAAPAGGENRESHIAFTAANRVEVRAFFDAAVAAGCRGDVRAEGMARVPPALLRSVRARSRRQQRRGGLSLPRVRLA